MNSLHLFCYENVLERDGGIQILKCMHKHPETSQCHYPTCSSHKGSKHLNLKRSPYEGALKRKGWDDRGSVTGRLC